jgi:HlyD family secretion protein
MKQLGLGLVLPIFLGLAACTSPFQASQPSAQLTALPPRASRTPLPTREVLVDARVTANGALALRSPVVSAGFDINGKVTSVRVRAGQSVKRGDVLATLDETDLRDAIEDAKLSLDLTEANIRLQAVPTAKEDLDAAKAALASANASYAQTKSGAKRSEIETAQRNLDAAWLQYLGSQVSRDVHCGGPFGTAAIDCKQREANYGNAYESWLAAKASLDKVREPVSRNTLTQAYANVTSAQAKVDTLNAELGKEQRKLAEVQYEQAKAAYERAQAKLVKATLTAPCDCVVQEVKIAVGGAASANAFVLVDARGLQFQTTNLSERDLGGLKPGATAQVRLKAHAEPLTGKVVTILSQSSGQQSGVALFTVLIDVDPADKLLLPGMTGQAEIVR